MVLRWLNTDDEGNTAIATGTVSVFEPPRVLELDTDIHGRIRWELEGAPDGCVLTLTVVAELPDDFVTEVAAAARAHRLPRGRARGQPDRRLGELAA